MSKEKQFFLSILIFNFDVLWYYLRQRMILKKSWSQFLVYINKSENKTLKVCTFKKKFSVKPAIERYSSQKTDWYDVYVELYRVYKVGIILFYFKPML